MARLSRLRTLRVPLVALLAGPTLAAAFLLSPASAQETPVETPAEIPTDEQPSGGEPVVRIEIDAVEEPIPKGDEFQVRVLVDNVEHLAAFDFRLQYDPDRVEAVKSTSEVPDSDAAEGDAGPTPSQVAVVGEFGQFLKEDPEREPSTICAGPAYYEDQLNLIIGGCATLGPPLCFGGLEGARGSGELGVATFKSKGGDMTTFTLLESTLISDDVAPPCDPEIEFEPQRIQHRFAGEVTVLLSGGDGGASVILIAGIIVVVVVALLAAAGALIYAQRRSSS